LLPCSSVCVVGADITEVPLNLDCPGAAYQSRQQVIANVASRHGTDLADDARMKRVHAGIGEIRYWLARLFGEADDPASRVDFDNPSGRRMLGMEDRQGRHGVMFEMCVDE